MSLCLMDLVAIVQLRQQLLQSEKKQQETKALAGATEERDATIGIPSFKAKHVKVSLKTRALCAVRLPCHGCASQRFGRIQ
eukprot:3540075-Amphidinium_carterae.2